MCFKRERKKNPLTGFLLSQLPELAERGSGTEVMRKEGWGSAVGLELH